MSIYIYNIVNITPVNQGRFWLSLFVAHATTKNFTDVACEFFERQMVLFCSIIQQVVVEKFE